MDVSDDEFDRAPDILGNLCKIAADKVQSHGATHPV